MVHRFLQMYLICTHKLLIINSISRQFLRFHCCLLFQRGSRELAIFLLIFVVYPNVGCILVSIEPKWAGFEEMNEHSARAASTCSTAIRIYYRALWWAADTRRFSASGKGHFLISRTRPANCERCARNWMVVGKKCSDEKSLPQRTAILQLRVSAIIFFILSAINKRNDKILYKYTFFYIKIFNFLLG